MSELRTRIAHLAMVGLCLTWIGCGGGGPDPASDTAAAPDAPPPVADVGGGGGAPAPERARGKGELVARNDAEASAPADPVKAPEAPAAPADDKPAAAPKGDSSGTTELLNLGGGSAPAETPKESPAAGVPGNPGGSGGPPGYPPPQGGSGGSGPPPGYPQPQDSGGADQRGRFPGAPGGGSMVPPGGGNSGAGDGVPGGGSGRFPGAPGGGMGGPGGGNDAPPNFSDPMRGVTSFINAVRSKDRDRIAEATALRAPQEATKDSMKKLFTMILDGSVDDETIADLSKAFEGFQIVDHNEPRSSGKYGIILGKSNNKGGQFRRTVTLRKEAKGWKVCDITGQSELENYFPRGMTSRGRRR